MRWLKPKHTVASVIEMLLTGLADGSVVLQRKETLFPDFPWYLQHEAKRSKEYLKPLPVAELMNAFIDLLSKRQHPFVAAVDSLEALMEFLRELRLIPDRKLKWDLEWHLRLMLQRVSNLPAPPTEGRRIQATEDVVQLARMLEVASEERETAIVKQLATRLQIMVGEVLVLVLERAGWHTAHADFFEVSMKVAPSAERPELNILFNCVDTALSQAKQSRIEDVQTRIQVLRLALKREQAPMSMPAPETQEAEDRPSLFHREREPYSES